MRFELNTEKINKLPQHFQIQVGIHGGSMFKLVSSSNHSRASSRESRDKCPKLQFIVAGKGKPIPAQKTKEYMSITLLTV